MIPPGMSPPPVPAPAERFGAYQLVRYLTAGGMADLYLARRSDSEDDLVLKRIQRRYLDHTHVVKLFIDEGRIALTLDHPNIVRTLDVGQLDGTYYIAMEYIPGHDLVAIARRGVETGQFIPRPIAVGVVAQAATGLAYAHTHRGVDGAGLSIVHCDISPGNIVVSRRGTAKIVDFGIARAAIALRKEDGVAGKFNYMAPEQIRGEKVDARADLFSLGVILYELTVGKRLFRGKPAAVRRKVLEGDIPRPRDVRPDFPRSLERILGRLLARDPAKRYQTASALRQDLRTYLQEEEEGWGKREIALYMRDLFRAPRGLAPGAEFAEGTGDEELDLERAMPSLDVEIDPDDDDDDLFDEDTASFEGFEGDTEVDMTTLDGPAGARHDQTPVDGTPIGALDAAAARASVDVKPAVQPTRRTPDDGRPHAASGQVAVRNDQVPAPMVDKRRRAPRKVEVDGSDPTAQVRLPKAGQKGAPPSGEAQTALVRLPDRERRREAERASASVEPTQMVRAPAARRRRRRPSRISTGVVVGGCMVVMAVVLLILIFLGR
ncbi:MAG: serine/threonine protein kinase [Myxococcales bacterium]|nr:serine/threonine protein kinase [Myxococcales bacterium]